MGRSQKVGWVLLLGATFVMAFLGQERLQAADSKDSEPQKRLQEVSRWAKETVARLEIQDEQTRRAFQLKAGSLLRWSNPIVGEVYGDSYLWTDRKRPAAFLSIYARYNAVSDSRRLTFQSLSESPLIANLDDRVIWSPKNSGVEFTIPKSTGAPLENSRARKIQIKRIAGQYRGQIQEKNNSKRFRQLRLLTKPLYQYQSPEYNVDDGALFAFVDGTDPELLLLIEARRDKENERSWYVAPVRQNHRRLQLLHKDAKVWDAPSIAPPFPNPRISSPDGVYFNTRWGALSSQDAAE